MHMLSSSNQQIQSLMLRDSCRRGRQKTLFNRFSLALRAKDVGSRFVHTADKDVYFSCFKPLIIFDCESLSNYHYPAVHLQTDWTTGWDCSQNTWIPTLFNSHQSANTTFTLSCIHACKALVHAREHAIRQSVVMLAHEHARMRAREYARVHACVQPACCTRVLLQGPACSRAHTRTCLTEELTHSNSKTVHTIVHQNFAREHARGKSPTEATCQFCRPKPGNQSCQSNAVTPWPAVNGFSAASRTTPVGIAGLRIWSTSCFCVKSESVITRYIIKLQIEWHQNHCLILNWYMRRKVE